MGPPALPSSVLPAPHPSHFGPDTPQVYNDQSSSTGTMSLFELGMALSQRYAKLSRSYYLALYQIFSELIDSPELLALSMTVDTFKAHLQHLIPQVPLRTAKVQLVI